MKKGATVIIVLFTFNIVFSQTVATDRVIARQNIILKDVTLDSIQRDTAFQNKVSAVPTSDAVNRFVDSRISKINFQANAFYFPAIPRAYNTNYGIFFGLRQMIHFSGDTTNGNSTNFVVGIEAGRNITTGVGNQFIGDSSGRNVTTGSALVGIGKSTLQKTTTGSFCVAIGNNTFKELTTGASNIGIGGNIAGLSTTGSHLIGIGTSALANNTVAAQAIAIGTNALRQYNSTTEALNLINGIAIGVDCNRYQTTGAQFVSIGAFSFGQTNVSTFISESVAIGYRSGYSVASSLKNIFIGAYAGQGSSSTLTNSIAIGHTANVSKDNAIVLGNVSTKYVGWGNGMTAPEAMLHIKGNSAVDTIFRYDTYNGVPVVIGKEDSTVDFKKVPTVNGIPIGSPFKVYTALLTQVGSSDPIVTVLANTTGTTFNWTRTATGFYQPQSATLSDPLKAAVLASVTDVNYIPVLIVDGATASPVLKVYDRSTGSLTDGGLNSTLVEVRIYP